MAFINKSTEPCKKPEISHKYVKYSFRKLKQRSANNMNIDTFVKDIIDYKKKTSDLNQGSNFQLTCANTPASYLNYPQLKIICIHSESVKPHIIKVVTYRTPRSCDIKVL